MTYQEKIYEMAKDCYRIACLKNAEMSLEYSPENGRLYETESEYADGTDGSITILEYQYEDIFDGEANGTSEEQFDLIMESCETDFRSSFEDALEVACGDYPELEALLEKEYPY